ncbi:MAG: glycosyltransferase [Saprospiraceae bacterium]|nr:glycosyltransferase [Saprospiraceae bacterium]
MHKTFLSVVSPVHPDIEVVKNFIEAVSETLRKYFLDYELILVNPKSKFSRPNLKEDLSKMDPMDLKNVCIYHFSNDCEMENAIVGGLDNAHGDYVILLDMQFYRQTDLIEKLYIETQKNFDIVSLEYRGRGGSRIRKLLLRIFYRLLRKYSGLQLDYKTHSNRIISRRALNRLLTIRSDWNFLKANLSQVGFPATSLVTDISDDLKGKKLYDEMRLALSILISRTTILNKLFVYLFIASSLFSVLVIINAILVRFTGHDILGFPQQHVAGWAFTIIFLAITFNILLIILYFLYIYLTNIYSQVLRRPLYGIDSVEKF